MKFSDLKGKYLRGIMEYNGSHEFLNDLTDNERIKVQLILFLGKPVGIMNFLGKPMETMNSWCVALVSDNQDYSYYTNWRIVEIDEKKVVYDDTYKSIGEIIEDIHTDGDNTIDSDNIDVDGDLWIKSVGSGDWLATDGANYFYVYIKTKTKQINLGTVYYDCHYPDTIWDVI